MNRLKDIPTDRIKKLNDFDYDFLKMAALQNMLQLYFFMKGQDLQRMWSILTPKTPTASKGDWKKIQ